MTDDEVEAASSALASLADHLHDLVAIFDSTGKVRYVNRTGRRLLRLDADGALPTFTIDSIASSEDRERLHEVLGRVRQGDPWSGPLSVVSPITGEFPTRSTICQVQYRGEDAIGWVAKDTTTDRDVINSIRQRAFYDPETGLSHRSLFLDRLDLLLRRVGPESTAVAVMLVGLDRFKETVNRFDRDVRSLLLKGVARRLPSVLTDGESVHRWSDDEFVILCEGASDETSARALASRISATFEQAFGVGDAEVYLSPYIGVALGHPGEMGTDEAMRHAAAATQLAKTQGAGAIRFFDEELRRRSMRRAEIEDALRGAGGRGELVLYYQPEVLLRTNQIVACEALVRWNHPEWGLVSPGEFIPVAESTNLILEIGDWVMGEAMRQNARWALQFPERNPITTAINVSSKQFVEDDFELKVGEALAAAGADPNHICLEITEGVLLDDAEETINKLGRLKKLGVHLAIDDFGTGYSSLSYLRRFPVDILKVDQSFVAGLGHDPEDSAIVQAVVRMGQALNMTTLAEGVETAHHLIELRELDCDIVQGFHFARPQPVEDFDRLLAAGDDWLNTSAG